MKSRGAALALVLLVAVCHLPALPGGWLWTDDVNLTANPLVLEPGGLRKIWLEPALSEQYYPLGYTLFRLEHALWGLRPAGYRAVNLLIHALAALLVYVILRRLAVPGAWLAALWFGVHPVQVESVAWVTQRKNVLSGALAAGAALAFLRATALGGFAGGGRSGRGDRTAPGWLALSVLLFAAALLSKTAVVGLPVALAVVWWWKRGSLPPRVALALAPLLLLGLAAGLVTVWMETAVQGARGAEWSVTPLERLLLAGRAFWSYLAALAWPRGLSFVNPRWQVDAGQWWQYLPPAAAAAAALLLWRLRGWAGRGPLAALLVFGALIAPALGFVNIFYMRYASTADHWQYFACAAPLALAAAGLTRAASPPGGTRARAALAAAVVVSTLLAVLCWRRSGEFRDDRALWERTIEANPRAGLAHLNLGAALIGEGNDAAALRHLRIADEEIPVSAEVPANLGILAYRRGEIGSAADLFETAVRRNPGFPGALVWLGDIRAEQGDRAAAEHAYRRALAIDPGDRNAARGLAGLSAAARPSPGGAER